MWAWFRVQWVWWVLVQWDEVALGPTTSAHNPHPCHHSAQVSSWSIEAMKPTHGTTNSITLASPDSIECLGDDSESGRKASQESEGARNLHVGGRREIPAQRWRLVDAAHYFVSFLRKREYIQWVIFLLTSPTHSPQYALIEEAKSNQKRKNHGFGFSL